ncbi:MAG: GNAT family N-acetyltransferase, partial [Chitinophagaceae bacterium]|nr:GNAT family N-acetyltransferase [Anaerolineae bacterium]
LNLGARQEHAGLVDVIYHPTSKLANLNYVMPRKNTAWIPGHEVEAGLKLLRQKDRLPRVVYVEGLFLPLFAKTLRELGLLMEQETSIMVYKLDDLSKIGAIRPSSIPDGITIQNVDDQEGVGMWWYVRQNAIYDVLTRSVEPIYIGNDLRAVTLGQQQDILLYRHGFPAGVARLTLHKETAHLTTLAVMREFRAPEITRMLLHAALRAAAERKCTLVFTSGDTEADRRVYRDVGFVDYGSLVCYAESIDHSREDSRELAQPVFALY